MAAHRPSQPAGNAKACAPPAPILAACCTAAIMHLRAAGTTPPQAAAGVCRTGCAAGAGAAAAPQGAHQRRQRRHAQRCCQHDRPGRHRCAHGRLIVWAGQSSDVDARHLRMATRTSLLRSAHVNERGPTREAADTLPRTRLASCGHWQADEVVLQRGFTYTRQAGCANNSRVARNLQAAAALVITSERRACMRNVNMHVRCTHETSCMHAPAAGPRRLGACCSQQPGTHPRARVPTMAAPATSGTAAASMLPCSLAVLQVSGLHPAT